MPDEVEHPIERQVRDRQESALETLTDLRQGIVDLATELAKRPTDEELRHQLRDQREALDYNRKRGLSVQRILGTVLLFVLLLVGAPLLINSFANRDNSNTIKNCTTPGDKEPTAEDPFDTGHKCFDDGKRGTADILTKAAENEVIILTCYRDENLVLRPQTVFVQCVKDRLTPELKKVPE